MHIAKSTLFYRYALSYVLILFLPLAILGFFYSKVTLRVLKENLIALRESEIRRGGELVDDQIQQIWDLCIQISGDSDFQPFTYPTDLPRVYGFLREINRYKAPNNFIRELLVHFRVDSYLYCGFEAFREDVYLEHYFPYAGRAGALVEFFQSGVEPEVWSDGNQILFLIPIPYGGRFPEGTLLVYVDTGTLGQFFPEDIPVSIYEPSGSLVAAFGSGAVADSLRKTDAGTIAAGDASMPVVYSSQGSHWTYAGFVPLDVIDTELGVVRTGFLIAVLIVLVVGLVLTFAFTYLNYGSIRRLKEHLERLTGRKVAQGDDLQQIRSVLTESWNDMRGRIDRGKPAMRDRLLYDTIRGFVPDVESFNERGMEVGLHWNRELHGIVIARPETGDRGSVWKAVKILDAALRPSMEGTAMLSLDQSRIIYCIGTDEEDRPTIRSQIQRLMDRAVELLGYQVTAGCSSFKAVLGDLGHAYLEASAALDYHVILGKSKTIFFDSLGIGPETEYEYPYRKIHEFRRSLLGGDVGMAEKILREAAEDLRRHAPPLVFARRVYAGFMAVAMNALKMGSDSRLPLSGHSYPVGRMFPENAETLEELIDGIHDLAEKTGTIAYASEQSGSTVILEMLDYIDSHYDDSGLSLQFLADRFTLHPAYVSTLFKKHGQRNLSDYIWSLRLERAKEMLRDTHRTVSDIVQAVGYMDTSSFIRKFRRSEGITPGEYRTRHAGRVKTKKLDNSPPIL